MLTDEEAHWYDRPIYKYFLLPVLVAVVSGVIVVLLTR